MLGMEFMKFGKNQQEHLRENGESWSILEEVRECEWGEECYLWDGIYVIKIECDKKKKSV